MKLRLALLGWLTTTPAMAIQLPTPPDPPANSSPGIAAPIPNSDFQAPVAPPEPGPTFALKFYRMQTFDPAMGFAPGSRYRTTEDRKPIQTPGFSISVPLK